MANRGVHVTYRGGVARHSTTNQSSLAHTVPHEAYLLQNQ